MSDEPIDEGADLVGLGREAGLDDHSLSMLETLQAIYDSIQPTTEEGTDPS